MKEIEINQIDTHFEDCRLKDKNQEKTILSSILEQGIMEPLQCVQKSEEKMILLDGFKRLRSAEKLGINAVPVVSLGSDEASGILRLLRLSNVRGLSILEQAALIDKLKQEHGLGVREIARKIEHSPAWVSVRLGVIGEMSPEVKKIIFEGRFPVRSYMYTIRPFTRVNKITKSDVSAFVKTVSGKGLSIRDIDTLANGFFNGGSKLKEQILKGNYEWTLEQLKAEAKSNSNNLSELETKTLRDLEIARNCMNRIPYELKDSRLKSLSFFTEADLLAEGIMKKVKFFVKAVEVFYDNKRRQKKSNTHAV